MSNEKKGPNVLLVRVFVGDEILPSDIGIIVNQYKDPYETTRIQWKVGGFFCSSGDFEDVQILLRLRFCDVICTTLDTAVQSHSTEENSPSKIMVV